APTVDGQVGNRGLVQCGRKLRRNIIDLRRLGRNIDHFLRAAYLQTGRDFGDAADLNDYVLGFVTRETFILYHHGIGARLQRGHAVIAGIVRARHTFSVGSVVADYDARLGDHGPGAVEN